MKDCYALDTDLGRKFTPCDPKKKMEPFYRTGSAATHSKKGSRTDELLNGTRKVVLHCK